MKIKNKYGIVSGGYIFDLLDRAAHEEAIKHIGECLTVNADIHYLRPVLNYEGMIVFISYQIIQENKITIFLTYKDKKELKEYAV